MTKSRWLAMAILAGLAGILIVSSASGQRLIGTFSAVIFDYEVSDEDGINFATEFERLGGVDTLGHPASYRFQLGDGFIYQLTQGALLQWRPEVGRAFLGNTFELLEQAGLDEWLLRAKGIPRPIKNDGSDGDWVKAKMTRFSWLTNERLRRSIWLTPTRAGLNLGVRIGPSSCTDCRCRTRKSTDRS